MLSLCHLAQFEKRITVMDRQKEGQYILQQLQEHFRDLLPLQAPVIFFFFSSFKLCSYFYVCV